MAAGYRSLLAFWAGGAAGGVAPTTQGGVRSMLAPWIGGASAPSTPATQGGYRSLLAFWAGGATGLAGTPTPGGVIFGGGGGGRVRAYNEPSLGEDFPERIPYNDSDDEEVILILSQMLRVLQ